MTLEEFDNALTQLHLDLQNPLDLEVRDRILSLHGQTILNSKKHRCSICWLKEKGRACNDGCQMYNIPNDPKEASLFYISHPNDINLFSFICMFLVPVYEEITGNRNTMEQIAKEFRRKWREKYKEEGQTSY